MHHTGIQLAMFGRVALAAVFGFVIGLEREARGKSAGERTFALVAIAAAAFGSFAMEIFPGTGGQVLSGVAAGIGFLGVGIIWRGDMGHAHGLTTAAAMWTVAAVGLMAGLGLYVLGALASALVFLILEFDRIPVMRRLHDWAAGHRGSAPPEDAEPTSSGPPASPPG
ncbi:MAG: putative Mg2+ transporter-C (MgtC) family protein [Actinomycetota bacterium]|jgi:putative Mg2+ transporter-C (MgtC) family protein|nr:putative Mg2+ transporter-C (MgtC) family protein [Actinomycetota bacterium]